jgi:hypothetical protein
MTLKLSQICKDAESPQNNMKPVFQRLSDYCEEKFQKACYLFENSPSEA